MLLTLQNFMVPLSRHIELIRAVDSMLRAGYVGRVPQTSAHAARFQAIYENQKAGMSFSQSASCRAAQISGLLIGMSGMGKTTTLLRWCCHMPQVIYHPDLNLYQVTYLHVEMPSDGSSVKGLAHAILHQLDRLIPGANYYATYAGRGRPGADSLMRAVARLLHIHCVGLLIGDEVQNVAHARKGSQVVMTELVSACNELSLPILFVGTNKAAKVFSQDFRLSRRASGNGLEPWRNYPSEVAEGEVDEWGGFIDTLWGFQWTRRPVALDAQLKQLLYHYSQGVIDIAIKLVASCQARAILDGSERITPELMTDVYNRELKLLHPMIEAIREDDVDRLVQYDDIAPVGLADILDSMARKLKGKASAAIAVKPSDPTFVPRLAASLVSSGFDAEEAEPVAMQVAADSRTKNLLDGTRAALELLTAPKKLPKARGPKEDSSTPQIELEDASDYRNAVVNARRDGIPVHAQLRALGMARPLEELIALD